MRQILGITLLLLFSASAHAQLVFQWDREYPSQDHPQAEAWSFDVVPGDGYVMVAEHDRYPLPEPRQARLLRLGDAGEIIWETRVTDDLYDLMLETVCYLPAAGPDQPARIITAGDITDFSPPFDGGGGCIYGFDTDGNEMWSLDMRRNPDEWNREQYTDCAILPDRSIVLAGDAKTMETNQDSPNAVRLTRISPDGDVLLDTVHVVGNSVWIKSLEVLPDGSYLLGGFAGNHSPGYIAHLGPDGDMISDVTLPESKRVVDIAYVPGDQVYVLCTELYHVGWYVEYWRPALYRLDLDLNINWQYVGPAIGDSAPAGIVVQDDGLIVVNTRNNVGFTKLSFDGQVLWSDTWGNANERYKQVREVNGGLTLCGGDYAGNYYVPQMTRFLFGDDQFRTLELVPDANPVILPPEGGDVQFTANYSSDLPLEISTGRFRVTHQSGNYQDVLVIPTLPLPFGEFSFPFGLSVPAAAPAGDYEVTAIVGPVDDPILTASFLFTKQATGTLFGTHSPLPSAENWPVTGAEQMLATLNGEEVDSKILRPTEPTLGQVYPNPFNPTASVTLDLPNAANVRVSVHDILGRELAVLVEGWQPAGRLQLTVDGSNWASGIYFLNAGVNGQDHVRRMVLMK